MLQKIKISKSVFHKNNKKRKKRFLHLWPYCIVLWCRHSHRETHRHRFVEGQTDRDGQT